MYNQAFTPQTAAMSFALKHPPILARLRTAVALTVVAAASAGCATTAPTITQVRPGVFGIQGVSAIAVLEASRQACPDGYQILTSAMVLGSLANPNCSGGTGGQPRVCVRPVPQQVDVVQCNGAAAAEAVPPWKTKSI